MKIWYLSLLIICSILTITHSRTHVAFLPFDDRVKLNEAWDLSHDIPRWFTNTIDTIGPDDSAICVLPYDTICAFIKKNGWKRSEYLSGHAVAQIGSTFDAQYIVSGAITKFKVVKRAMNTDASLNASHPAGSSGGGTLDMPTIAGLQSYRAEVEMTVDIYQGSTGKLVQTLRLYSDEKDGGIRIWLPIFKENDEMNFHYLSRTPFGSDYFHKSVAGAIMKRLSLELRSKIVALSSAQPGAMETAVQKFPEGKILERTGTDVYIDLGMADSIVSGEVFYIYKTGKPIIGEKGDTLGFTQQKSGEITVQFVRSAHFSQAEILSETDSIIPGCIVRQKNGVVKKK